MIYWKNPHISTRFDIYLMLLFNVYYHFPDLTDMPAIFSKIVGPGSVREWTHVAASDIKCSIPL